MYKLLVIVSVSLVLQVNTAEIQPRDLAEEAQNQLDTLRSLIKGDIQAAHDQLANLETDFNTYVNNVVSDGALSIQQEHGTAISQINTLKELASGAGKDVTTCTDSSETFLNRLPGDYTTALVNCGNGLIEEVSALLNNALYIVDVNINKIFSLESQLDRCRGSITCIQPIVTEIQLDMIRLPAAIKTEVNAVESQLSTVKLSVDQCSDVEVTAYVNVANSVVSDITDCINRILDRP